MSPFPIEPARAMGPMRLVVTTYPSPEAAATAVEGALARRLAACASSQAVESRYHWNGRLESASETLVVFKTVPKRVGALFGFLAATHPYDVPEIVELDVPRADAGYLTYLARTLDAASLDIPAGPRPRRRAGRRAPGARLPRRTRGRHRPPSR